MACHTTRGRYYSDAYQLPSCTHIHCLVSKNDQQTSLNINECYLSVEVNVILLLLIQFYVRYYFPRLPLNHYLFEDKQLPVTGGKVQPLLLYQQHPPPAFMYQYNKIEGVTFGATIVNNNNFAHTCIRPSAR